MTSLLPRGNLMKTLSQFANRYMKLFAIEVNNYILTMDSRKWESIAARATCLQFHDGYAHQVAKGFRLVYNPTSCSNIQVVINTSDNLIDFYDTDTNERVRKHIKKKQRNALEGYFIDYLYPLSKVVESSKTTGV